jgi:hypothetical protein
MSDSISDLIAGQRNASVIDSLANPAQVNVLGSITRASEAARNVLALRSAKAQQAWGDALQQATDPNTGVVDYPRAQAIASRDRDASMGMAAGLEASSGRQTEQANRGHLINGFLQGASAALPLNATRQQVIDMLNKGGAAGVIPSDILAKEIASVPTDEKQIPTYVQQLRDSALSAEQNFKLHYGAPGTMNRGPDVVGTNTNLYTGAVAPAGSGIPLGVTPEWWNTQIPDYKNPTNGQPEFMTNGMLMERAKRGVGAPPPPPVPGATAAPAPTPGTPGPGGAPVVAPGTSMPGAPVPPVPTGPRPDDKAKWEASSALYARDLEASTTYQQRIFPLAQVASILASGDVTTGQGADALNRAKSFLQTAAASMGWDAQTIQQAKYDEVTKYMQQYVNAQGMSARSDQALASAITGNPSSHLSTLANKEVVKPLLAVERMKQMATQDFKAGGGHPNDYMDFLSKWQTEHDPRAFLFDMLDDGQRRKMLTGMTKAELIRYNKTLDLVEHTPGILSLATMPH